MSYVSSDEEWVDVSYDARLRRCWLVWKALWRDEEVVMY